MIRALLVAGARPNFMKIAPIYRAMASASDFDPVLAHTGQHYDWQMSEVFLRDLGLPEPEVQLNVGAGSHAEQTAHVMLRLEPVLRDVRPDVVMVVGDVNSTVGAALTAVKLRVPVAHVEAGLRSFDRSMPEETNRIVTDAVSDLLFAPSPDAVANLRREGVADHRICLVGNVMIDSLDMLLPAALAAGTAGRLGLADGGYLVATLHRPSNVDNADSLRRAVEILRRAGRRLPTVFPAHPRTASRLSEADLDGLTQDNVRITDPLGYTEFVGLVAGAAAVLTDSGGLQEESTVLGVPCLTLREQTERPITVTHGTNVVVGVEPDRVAAALDEALGAGRPAPRRPALWDGHAAERIVEVLRRRVDDQPAGEPDHQAFPRSSPVTTPG